MLRAYFLDLQEKLEAGYAVPLYSEEQQNAYLEKTYVTLKKKRKCVLDFNLGTFLLKESFSII